MPNFYAVGQSIPESALLFDAGLWDRALRGLTAKATAEINAVFLQAAREIPLLPGDALLGTTFDVASTLRAVGVYSPDLQRTLYDFLVETAVMGMTLAADSIGRAPTAPLYHTWAQSWAREHAATLVTRITETTRQRLRDEIAAWIETGKPLADLRNRIRDAGPFSLERAKLIATTEATFAFTEGTFDLYESAGLPSRPFDRPPAHPGCRCFVGAAQYRDRFVYVWYTVVDDRVCHICQPKHLQVIGG